MTDLRVGLLGLGTVNTAVARHLLAQTELLAKRCGHRIVIAGVAVRDINKARDVDLGDVVVGADADALVGAAGVDVIVEAIGGTDPVRHLLAAAIESGKSVVTANKAVVAEHGVELSALALRHGVVLRHAAAVGGAVPMLEFLDSALQGDQLAGVEAICNGTTNFILGRMARESATFASALAEAQRLGFAEADPASDIDGWDAAYKLALLATHAWRGRVDAGRVRRRGIRGVEPIDLTHAADLNCVVKLLARATWSGSQLAVSVQPTLLVRGQHPLAGIDGADNGLLVRGDLSGTTLLIGTGAGGDATASAVISDIVRIARDGAAGWRPLPATPLRLTGDEDAEIAVYIRLVVNNSEAEDEVAQMLEDRGVPVVSVIDPGAGEVLVLTGAAPVAVVDRALATLDSMTSVDRVAAHYEVGGQV